jgi:hypothetical protein
MANVQDNPTITMADVNLKFTKPELQTISIGIKPIIWRIDSKHWANFATSLSGQRFGIFQS